MLEAENVVKRYGSVTALDSVSIRVEAGECVALVGESGSGKSTLLRCFNRMTDPDAGVVRVAGQPVTGTDPFDLRRRVGYVPQNGGLMPHWRVARNVGLVPWLRDQNDVEARSAEALARVGLPVAEYGSRWPSELSGGQRQRVAIARALAATPTTVLLDEPFGALDAITRGELHEQFRALRRELDLTMLLVTHDLSEAILLADRIAVLRNGRIEQMAPADTLRRTPATEYVARLLERAGVA